ncbi:MAG: FkbM family methyltransferase [Crocosphaera sp.]
MKTQLVQTDVGKLWSYVPSKITDSIRLPGSLKHVYPCILPQFFRPGDVCLDIGANIGTFSIPVAKLVGMEGRVFSFEPFAKTYELLDNNLKLNDVSDIVEPQAKVVSDHIQNLKSRPTPKNMGATWFKEDNTSSENSLLATTLDSWHQEHPDINSIDFVKIDVEGMEIKVLKGASKILTNYKPILYIEVCEAHYQRYGFSIKDLEELLQDRGYHFFRYVKPRWANKAAFRRLFSLTQGSRFYNLLAIHPEDTRYPCDYSRSDQAFIFMLGEKIDMFWNSLRSKYRLRTRIKNLIEKH